MVPAGLCLDQTLVLRDGVPSRGIPCFAMNLASPIPVFRAKRDPLFVTHFPPLDEAPPPPDELPPL